MYSSSFGGIHLDAAVCIPREQRRRGLRPIGSADVPSDGKTTWSFPLLSLVDFPSLGFWRGTDEFFG